MGELCRGIHFIPSVTNGRLLTCFLLIGDKASMLIDSGFAFTPGEVLFPYMEKIGRGDSPVTWLVVTHASGDHCGGNAAIKARFPGTHIVAHRLDSASISSHATFLEEHLAVPAGDGVPCPRMTLSDPEFLASHGREVGVDRTVQGDEVFDLCDGLSLILKHTPGHTPGHLMVFDEERKILFAGDGIMGEGIAGEDGRLAMPPHYFHPAWYLATIRLVQRLAPRHILATHYPPLDGEVARDFVESSGTFVRRYERWLLETLESCSEPVTIPTIVSASQRHLGIAGADYQHGLLARAHLLDLEERGCVTRRRERDGTTWCLSQT